MSSSWKTFQEHFGSFSGLLIICVVGILVLVGGGIIPTARKIEATRGEIADLRARQDRREALAPIHASVVALRSDRVPESLSLSEAEALQLDELSEFPAMLTSLADEANWELISATPQLRSIRGGDGQVRVDAHLRGDYLDARDFLLRLAVLPYLDRIEGLSVHSAEFGRELRVILWLNIQ